MRKRVVPVIAIVSLLGSLLGVAVASAPPAAAATVTVCASGCDFTTIQAAVTAAGTGDIVTVAAGAYDEIVTVDKSLTINGAQAGVDATSGSRPVVGSETEVTGFIIDPQPGLHTGAPVTLDGLLVDGSIDPGRSCESSPGVAAPLTCLGISMPSGVGHQFRNLIVQNNQVGIYGGAGGRDYTIRQSWIRDNNVPNGVTMPQGVFTSLPNGPGLPNTRTIIDSLITGNWYIGTADDTVFGGTPWGAGLNLSYGTAVITNNRFWDQTTPILVAAMTLGATPVTIEDNYFSGVATATGVQIWLGNSGLAINRNTFNGVHSPLTFVNLSPGGTQPPSTNASIIGNTFQQQPDPAAGPTGAAIHVARTAGGAASSSYSGPMTVSDNRIFDTAYGIRIDPDADTQISANRNWWGCNAGPAVAPTPPTDGPVEGCTTIRVDPDTSPPTLSRVDASAWLQFSVLGVPASISVGGATSTIRSALRNTGGDGSGAVSTGLPPTGEWITTTLGSIASSAEQLSAGLASTTLTSGSVPGTAMITATVDNAVLTTTVLFTTPVTPKFTG